MPSEVIAPASFALQRRLDSLRNLPRSHAYADFRGDVRQAVMRGLASNVMAGKDGMGRPMAALAPSTLANKRRGSGPPLAPRGQASRIFDCFRAEWVNEGGGWTLKRYWEGMDDKRGRPFMQYHLAGASRTTSRGNPWILPKRDVSQITPGAWAEIKSLHVNLIDRIRDIHGPIL